MYEVKSTILVSTDIIRVANGIVQPFKLYYDEDHARESIRTNLGPISEQCKKGLRWFETEDLIVRSEPFELISNFEHINPDTYYLKAVDEPRAYVDCDKCANKAVLIRGVSMYKCCCHRIIYNNHCWCCKSTIDTRMPGIKRCLNCGWYICPECHKCGMYCLKQMYSI